MPAVVVVPTYNEAGTIEALLREICKAAPVDVLVIDDHSPDGTGVLVDQLRSELPQVDVLHRPGKDGLGNAYRAGFAHLADTAYDAVVTMDADFSHDPRRIPALLSRLAAGADIVIGSRYVPGGGTMNWPLHRRLLSRWGNAYTATVLGLPVGDCTSGFRAYRSAALTGIAPASTGTDGYAFLTELIRRAHERGLTLAEIPITFVDRRAGESKMSAAIIAESMVNVTRWALSDRWQRVRRWSAAARSGKVRESPRVPRTDR